MSVPTRIAASAVARINAASAAIRNTVDCVRKGQPLEAEPIRQRKVERIVAVANVDAQTAARLADNQRPSSLGLTGESLARAEAIQGRTVDYLGVAWLEAGRIASRAVGRVLFSDGSANGTGFLVSGRLLLTNNHVIANPGQARGMMVEFRYEIPLGQRSVSPVRFALDPDTFFQTDEKDDLDYTLIAIGRPITQGATLSEFGMCPISASAAKHTVGEPVNIIQHPDGDYKQVVVRENRIVHRGDTVLHYLADTEPGASGSPVFNDQWQVVALHHWGSPHRELTANGRPLERAVNEGIRISAIVRELQGRTSSMNAIQRQLLSEAMNAPPGSDFGARLIGSPGSGPHSIISEPAPISFPYEDKPSMTPTPFSNEAGGGAPASRIDRHYSNRRGYNPRFLSGFEIPLPQLNADQRDKAARINGVGTAGNPFELKYQHFSVVLRADRRMSFFSACNIDGSRRIRVDRDTGKAVSGPEASETWALDPRIPEDTQLTDRFYAHLRRDLNAGDFFARGHLTRREDPNWGTADLAERANDDTFHHTNGCPQANKAFNSSLKVWQGIENFILDSTDRADLRVTVITGPIFADDDPVYEDEDIGEVPLPRRFWKIVAFVEEGVRKVFAMLADQSEAMDRLFQAAEGREAAFVLPKKLKAFKSTVAELEQLTELDFGDLANHDIFAGNLPESMEERLITGPESILRVPVEGSFGSFDSIGDFLEKWEEKQRPAIAEEEEEGAERKRRKKPRGGRPPQPPAARQRRVAEVEAQVARVFADDLSGAKHQQFSVTLTRTISVDGRIRADVQETLTSRKEVRLAVRFGDSRGLQDRIPGIRSGVKLHLKGEWIPAEEAFGVGGERLAVLHFTHDPLGFVCTPVECFS